MFERFRKSSAPQDEPGGVAVREREEPVPAEDATTVRDDETRPATAGETATTPRETEGERAATEDDRTLVREDDAERPSGTRRAGAAGAGAGAAGAVVAERERRHPTAPVVGDDTLAAMHERQRDRFGGTRWGSAFFGLLCAIGLASILLAVVAAAGVALGVSDVKDTANGTNDTIGLGGGIALLCVVAVAWYCGGYVAGRMARFDGPRQGFGVWCWTVLLAAAVAILGAIGGQDYNVLQQLNLPNVAVGGASFTTGGIIAGLCALVVTLIAAVAGGKAGDMYHRRVDRLAAREYEPAL
jgi:hypothetical protein